MPHGPVLENYYVAASVKTRQYHVTGYGPADVDIPGQAIVEWRYVRKDAPSTTLRDLMGPARSVLTRWIKSSCKTP